MDQTHFFRPRFDKMLNYSLIDATRFDRFFFLSVTFFLPGTLKNPLVFLVTIIACRRDLPVVLPRVTPGSVSQLLNEPLL